MSSSQKNSYDNQYVRDNYHRVSLNIRKEKYEEIKSAASENEESVNGYIKSAIDDRLEKDKKKKNTGSQKVSK